MKLKILLSLIFITLLFLTGPSKILADCRIANDGWDPATRSLQVCVGQFDSVAQLRNTTANANCLGNSNVPDFSACRGIFGQYYYMTSIPNNQISQDANGKYYTCFTFVGVNRAIGKMNVVFTGGQSCTTEATNTKPADWNPLTEGLPWQEGNVAPPAGEQIACEINGQKGINTALGCISYDATRGGFISSLLGVIIGLGGGVALLLILYGIFIITTSTGIPDKLNQGKEIIASAVAGLLFIILAIFLMNLIGIKILALPGLQ